MNQAPATTRNASTPGAMASQRLAAVVATTCWTSMLFGASLKVGRFLMDHFGAWRWLGAAGFVLFVIVAGRVAAAGMQGARR